MGKLGPSHNEAYCMEGQDRDMTETKSYKMASSKMLLVWKLKV